MHSGASCLPNISPDQQRPHGRHLRQAGHAKISPVQPYRSLHKRLRRSECPWLHILGPPNTRAAEV
ncbi:hypothetical protein GT037_005498 [Alternaria burnsii]|uniref:Uncharacterized protein n=1 Tax=Alternaria burnsii TaxID=1187904 RepID=A0A8H7B2B4_9PLEO|nr:uncharacterized protein GT037_005498 [Alternaria burnsii]KAF7675993.1 hypothetical protein GT037_005498 [Alternaria burnsii]KAH8627237.1 hypothetical protein IG631_17005 [Alternaria alternata]